MPRISVIVPAFDVGDYVGALLDDLERQTYRDFEVLVVDDGSTDDTRHVIERCTERDGRFRLLTTGGSGAGPSEARNLGLDHATGEELAFVDADDRLATDYLRRLHTSLVETGSDVASGNVRRLKGFETGTSTPHFRVFDRERVATHLRRTPELVYDSTIWNKLTRRSLWDETGIRFDEGRWINDIYPSLRLHTAARQVDILTPVLYYWRVRVDEVKSITTSKFVDPMARLKSLDDRFYALEQTRRMLQKELADSTVTGRFDERVLLHDLRVYLSLYAEADDRYREALSEAVRGYLTTHGVDPTRHELGAFLHETYRAILADDADRLAFVLAPSTRLAGFGQGRRIKARLTASSPARLPQRRRWSDLVRLRRAGSGEIDVTDRLDARVRIARVRLDSGRRLLHVSGEARIRDGRDNLEGTWRIRLIVNGQRGGSSQLRPAPRIRSGPTGGHEHPLLLPGWRSFEASVDLPVATKSTRLPSWPLTGVLLLDGAEVAVTPYLTTAARRTLASGVPLARSLDILPVPSPDGSLVLRAEAANVQLLGALPQGDEVILRVVYTGRAIKRLTLRTATGDEVATADTPDGTNEGVREVVMPIPDPGEQSTRWELWAHYERGDERVRADPSFTATWLQARASRSDAGMVLRPTTRGRIVLDQQSAHLEIDGVVASSHLALHGRVVGPYQASAEASLEARCPWTEARVTGDFRGDAGVWEAQLPFPALTAGVETSSRMWSLHLIDSAVSDDEIGVGTWRRDRFPLSVPMGSLHCELRVSRDGKARLWVGAVDLNEP